MIDIHCHILHGLDDGPENIEHSLELARAAVAEGVTAVIATPHCIPEVFFNEREAVLARVKELQALLEAEGIPLKVLPGMEAHLTLDLAKRLGSGSSLTLCNNGKYVLLEFPLSLVPAYAGQVIFEIMLKGIKPIIAHPERNKEIAENPSVLYNFIEKGCLVQVTSGSVTGEFGRRVQHLTRDFLRLGWVDFIASDAHHPVRRPLQLKEACRVAEELIGEEQCSELVLGNPQKVITGEAIIKSKVLPYTAIKGNREKARKKSFWSGLSAVFKK